MASQCGNEQICQIRAVVECQDGCDLSAPGGWWVVDAGAALTRLVREVIGPGGIGIVGVARERLVGKA